MSRLRIGAAAVAMAVVAVPLGSVRAASVPAPAPPAGLSSVPVCPLTPAPGHVTCFARVLTRNGHPVRPRVTGGQPQVSPALPAPDPTGLTPDNIRSAYSLPVSSVTSPTVAIVDVFDDPNAVVDLGVYRSQYSLGPCTVNNGCFRKVDLSRGTTDPAGKWELEESLDMDAVSAACPSCRILLVEASDTSPEAIAVATATAVALGATTITMSLGAFEVDLSQGPPAVVTDFSVFDSAFAYPGVSIFAAAGDEGNVVSYPAVSPRVVGVGGTTLSGGPLPGRWAEQAWPGTGSGCSLFEPKPPWQNDVGCSMRTSADVAAVADPNRGLSIYDSTLYGDPAVGQSVPQWTVVGGTSLSTPLVAAMTARGGGGGYGSDGRQFYGNNSALHDVTTGSDGVPGIVNPNTGTHTCRAAYLCTAAPGYDGPTGNGTPDGLPTPEPFPVLAVRGTDSALWVKLNAQGFAFYGGQLRAAPAVASTGDGDHVYIALGVDHQLWQRSDLSGWLPAVPPGTYCVDNPAVFVSPPFATIACEGADGGLYANEGTISGGVFRYGFWQALGGRLASGPSIALVQGGLHYYVDGLDHTVYDHGDAGYTATSWACIGHPGVSNSGSTAYFTCDGLDGQEWVATNVGGRGWGQARSLGGRVVDGTAVAAFGWGATTYVAGADGSVWSAGIDSGGTVIAGWTPVGGACIGGTAAAGP